MKNFRPEYPFDKPPVVDGWEVNRRLRVELAYTDDAGLHHDPARLAALAQAMMHARAIRGTHISSDLFSEAGWEMLLALFCADAAGRRTTISNLCNASCGPATTALRWLDKLVERDLVKRVKNPLDARVIFIELQPAARSAMRSYLSEALSVVRKLAQVAA